MSHALLSPSSASRWMSCTPSARLEQKFGDTTSSYAEEGTVAHAVSETLLRYDNGLIDKTNHDIQMTAHRRSEYFVAELFSAALEYSSYVNEFMEAGCDIYIEQRLDMTRYIPEGFGTADAIIINYKKKVLRFFDLKYGKGIRVNAENNKQLMVYALGALEKYDPDGLIKTVVLTIYQPRLDNISVWEISVKDLKKWAEEELTVKAKMAFEGSGGYFAGEHCVFCKAKTQCKALYDYNMELAKLEFSDPDLITDSELVEVLTKKDIFVNWINGIAAYALEKALDGKKWNGFKLVEGKSNRKYIDEETLSQKLKDEGFDMLVGIYTEPKLIGITEMEKRLGKKEFSEHVSPFVVKPQGKPVLVDEKDSRPAFNDPKLDFSEPLDSIDDLF